MSVSINDLQDEIIEEFAMFDDWADKYEYIIDMGKKLPTMPEEYKTEETIVKGCQSKVWLHENLENGILKFAADSDAIIVKGLVAMLLRVLSGHNPAEIAKADLYFIEKIGMNTHLAPTRSNGLVSMIQKMKLIAAQNS
jgi:cysteine desulfuration protein SufE